MKLVGNDVDIQQLVLVHHIGKAYSVLIEGV